MVDKCPGCPQGGLDASPAVFSALADQSNILQTQTTYQLTNTDLGVVIASWEYVSCSRPTPGNPLTQNCGNEGCQGQPVNEPIAPVVKPVPQAPAAPVVKPVPQVPVVPVVKPMIQAPIAPVVKPVEVLPTAPVTGKPVPMTVIQGVSKYFTPQQEIITGPQNVELMNEISSQI